MLEGQGSGQICNCGQILNSKGIKFIACLKSYHFAIWLLRIMGGGKGQCLGLRNSHWSPVHYAHSNKDIFFPSKLVDVQLFLPKLPNSAASDRSLWRRAFHWTKGLLDKSEPRGLLLISLAAYLTPTVYFDKNATKASSHIIIAKTPVWKK